MRRFIVLNYKLTVGLAMALLLVGVSGTQVYADDQLESITLSPTTRKYQIDAGSTVQDTLTVINDGKTSYDFSVYSAPYSIDTTTGEPKYESSTAINADANKWIRFSKTMWHADAGQTIKVPYSMTIRSDESPGGHYGVIFAEVQPTGGTSGTGLARKKRVGMVVLATVKGDVKLSGSSKKTEIAWYQSQAPLRVIAEVANTGNTDFNPTISYQVNDLFGNTKYKSTTSDYVVLPGLTRKIQLEWDQASWLGFYNVQVSTTVLGATTTVSGYVLIAPQWFIWTTVIILLASVIYAVRHTRKK